MDLFEYSLQEQLKKEAPLADRMRPRVLDEFFGQEHILSKGRLLRRAIQADQLSSIIFYGPPGTGKTTLARIIANTTKSQFISLNAVLSGVKNIRESIEQALTYRKEQQRKTILFVDEVHRFNKAQQDALLPHVENGTITLVGATTENPYFEVNKALVSRSRIFQLCSLTQKDLDKIITAAFSDKERGFGLLNIEISQEARDHLTLIANGDARALLNALELAVVTSIPNSDGIIRIDLETAEDSIQHKAVLYDKDGDAHFDTISAFIKSLRGSDPDAALYWMAKMIYGGEDPKFLFRRMIIFAAEDIGLADPNALQVTISASQAFDYVGMPEGRFHLAEACLYLSTAPKSNSCFAFFDALETVRNEARESMPNHIKDGSRDKKGLGHGEGYLYPHSYNDHWVAQQYLPDTLQGKFFYQPGELGYEAKIKESVFQKRDEQLTILMNETSPWNDHDLWKERTLNDSTPIFGELRDQLFSLIQIDPNDLVFNLNAGNCLLLRSIIQAIKDEAVYVQVFNEQERSVITHQFINRKQNHDPVIVNLDHGSIREHLAEFQKKGIRFNYILGLSFFTNIEKKLEILSILRSMLTSGGQLVCVEKIPELGQRLSAYTEGFLGDYLQKQLKITENEIYCDPKSAKTNWQSEFSEDQIKAAGFELNVRNQIFENQITLLPTKIESWFNVQSSQSMGSQLAKMLPTAEVVEIKNTLIKQVCHQPTVWKSCWRFYQLQLLPLD
jgi:putative ATPase